MGEIKVEVFLYKENIWLSQDRIAQLFGVDRTVITKHLQNIFKDEELDKFSTSAKFAQVQKEGGREVKRDIAIAKNYLNQGELQRLNRMVSAFFDLAELKAMEHQEMKMQDWITELDKFTNSYGKGTLEDTGKISHQKAMKKVEKEYKKYQVKTLSPIEKEYLETIKKLEKDVLKNKN
jgi:hypothetical protein